MDPALWEEVSDDVYSCFCDFAIYSNLINKEELKCLLKIFRRDEKRKEFDCDYDYVLCSQWTNVFWKRIQFSFPFTSIEETDFNVQSFIHQLSDHVYFSDNPISFKHYHKLLAPVYLAIFTNPKCSNQHQWIQFDDVGITISGDLGKAIVLFSHHNVSISADTPMFLIPIEYGNEYPLESIEEINDLN